MPAKRIDDAKGFSEGSSNQDPAPLALPLIAWPMATPAEALGAFEQLKLSQQASTFLRLPAPDEIYVRMKPVD